MNCSGILNSPHFKGGPSITSLNGSMVHYRDEQNFGEKVP